MSIDASTFDTARGQYDGTAIVSRMADASTSPETTLIALSNADLFVSIKPEWRYAFSARVTRKGAGALAVISPARMSGPNQRRRLLVMLGKYIALLSCGFESSSNPRSITFDNVMGPNDLDAMDAVVCNPS